MLDSLLEMGYRVIAPTIDQAAIVYEEIHSIEQLPQGWTDEQNPGEYRLRQTGSDRYFDYAVGPHSWKRYLFPPLQRISTAVQSESGWDFHTHEEVPEKLAFLGVRACELAAIRTQDRVFLEGSYVDSGYERRREAALVISVNCAVASSSCFCTSMGTGPRCDSGFDLSLTELTEGLLIEVGTDQGAEIVDSLPVLEATSDHINESLEITQKTEQQITRHLDTEDIRNRLMGALEHPQWSDIADRCLSCTNCTMVCPTCFCSQVTEVPSLDQSVVERERVWDSCFHPDFTSLNGQPVRNDIRSRYRQWLTHKLATWHDQFGESGCVGCGRCITWCPVGIDLTREVPLLCGGDDA